MSSCLYILSSFILSSWWVFLFPQNPIFYVVSDSQKRIPYLVRLACVFLIPKHMIWHARWNNNYSSYFINELSQVLHLPFGTWQVIADTVSVIVDRTINCCWDNCESWGGPKPNTLEGCTCYKLVPDYRRKLSKLFSSCNVSQLKMRHLSN